MPEKKTVRWGGWGGLDIFKLTNVCQRGAVKDTLVLQIVKPEHDTSVLLSFYHYQALIVAEFDEKEECELFVVHPCVSTCVG